MLRFDIHLHHYYHSGDDDQGQHLPADPQVLTLLEKIMSQIEDLQADGVAIKGDLDQIKTYLTGQNDKLAALQAQLEQLQQSSPPQVDLTPALTLAAEIKDEADAIVASFTPSQPAPSGDGSGSSDTGASDSSGAAVGDGGSSDPGSTDTSGAPAGDGGDTSGTQTTDTQP